MACVKKKISHRCLDKRCYIFHLLSNWFSPWSRRFWHFHPSVSSPSTSVQRNISVIFIRFSTIPWWIINGNYAVPTRSFIHCKEREKQIRSTTFFFGSSDKVRSSCFTRTPVFPCYSFVHSSAWSSIANCSPHRFTVHCTSILVWSFYTRSLADWSVGRLISFRSFIAFV